MLASLLIGCLIPTVMLAVPTSNSLAKVPPSKTVSREILEANIRSFWTPERLKAAKPLEIIPKQQSNKTLSIQSNVLNDGPPSSVEDSLSNISRRISKAINPNGKQVSTMGIVFLTINNEPYSCSGGVVSSPSLDLVITAAHCVYNATANTWYNDNWIFFPAYSNGHKPYGTWIARTMAVSGSYTSEQDFNYDVAFVPVSTLNGQHIQSVVGAQGIAFNWPRVAFVYIFGYPLNIGGTNYLGMCSRNARNSQSTGNGFVGRSVSCDMTGGSSGGPWLQNVTDLTGIGHVTAVVSFGVSTFPNFTFSAYFGSDIETLYTFAKTL